MRRRAADRARLERYDLELQREFDAHSSQDTCVVCGTWTRVYSGWLADGRCFPCYVDVRRVRRRAKRRSKR